MTGENKLQSKGDANAGFLEKNESPPLEFRLERIKRSANLRLYYLDLFHYSRTISECYLDGRFAIHLHFADAIPFCISFRRCLDDFRWPAFLRYEPDHLPVLVRIVEVPKEPCPVASFVRLQTLDCCYVGFTDPIEVLITNPRTTETLWRVFDRKLSALADLPRVTKGHVVNHVIECSSQMEQNFRDTDTNFIRYRRIIEEIEARSEALLDLGVDSITLRLPESIDPHPRILEMFICPAYSEIGAMEVIHEVDSQYERQPAGSAQAENAEGIRDTNPQEGRVFWE